MSKLTQELRNRTIERGQWSGLDKHRSDLRLNGSGEGYVEELYFGKGFSSPPSFTYSAVFNQDEQEILSWFLTPPRNSITTALDQYGMGNDSISSNGGISDPGFESQAKYHVLDANALVAAQLIPTVNTWFTAAKKIYSPPYTYDGWRMPIAEVLENNTYTNDWAPKYYAGTQGLLGPHRWFQTDDYSDLWSVDLTEHHDLGVGEAGQASATAVIGSSGYTNWLIPIDRYYTYQYVQDDPATQWRCIRSVNEYMEGSYNGGIFAQSYPPPYLGGYEGFLYVKSDGPVTIETSATFASEDVDPGVTRGEKIFENREYWDSGSNSESWLSQFNYRELASLEHKATYGGGDWSRINIELPYTGWRAWPQPTNLYDGFDIQEPADTYWNFRFRVKGDPGTVVHLDNIFLNLQMRNEEIPALTVGVDEWIRDESGVYIGAKLWVKMGAIEREN